MITYVNTANNVIVKLDGKKVGEIVSVPGGFAYFPSGRVALRGDVFPTIQAVKRSLEGDE